jgi:hypothetical protein
VLLLKALVIGLVLGACGSTSSTPASHAGLRPTHQDFAQIRRLLATRAHAVLHHREQAFMATVDDRDGRLVTQQRTLFENLSQLSIASLRYVMDPSVDLVPARVAGGDPALRPQVYEFLQIAGTMQHPVSNALEETFVEHDGHWLLGAESAAGDNDSFDAAQERPWFGVPTVARRLGVMTVVVDRTDRATLAPLTRAIHADILFDAAKLGIAPNFEILVDATSNGNATLFNGNSTEQAGAVTFALREDEPRDPSTFKVLAGHAIKLNPHHAAADLRDVGLLRHELTHFLLHEYTGTNPEWLVEGVATWMQYYPDDFASWSVSPGFYHRLMSDRALPIIGLFKDDPDVNYTIAEAAVTWLVSHYGVPKLLELMKAYSAHYQGANSDALTPLLVKQVYGITEKQVVDGTFALLATYRH